MYDIQTMFLESFLSFLVCVPSFKSMAILYLEKVRYIRRYLSELF